MFQFQLDFSELNLDLSGLSDEELMDGIDRLKVIAESARAFLLFIAPTGDQLGSDGYDASGVSQHAHVLPYSVKLRAVQSYNTKMRRDLLAVNPEAAAVIEGILASPGTEVAEEPAVVERAARPGRRQGRQISPEGRAAVELYAMGFATAHYEKAGWIVRDVSRHESYDLLCTREDEELHVEVKGTRSAGDAVLLTRNEVVHARGSTKCALFIVADVIVDHTADPPIVTGGHAIIYDPWEIATGTLRAVSYEYWPSSVRNNDRSAG